MGEVPHSHGGVAVLTVTVVMLSCHRQDQRPHCPVQIQYKRGAPHSSDQRMLQKYLLSTTPPSHPLLRTGPVGRSCGRQLDSAAVAHHHVYGQ
jgi:hypothetical protein